MARQWMSVKDAAARMAVSPMTVYRLVYDGVLTPYNIGRGKTKPRIRLDEAEVDAHMASCAT
jgi:excisionase family DNA binding protein